MVEEVPLAANDLRSLGTLCPPGSISGVRSLQFQPCPVSTPISDPGFAAGSVGEAGSPGIPERESAAQVPGGAGAAPLHQLHGVRGLWQ